MRENGSMSSFRWVEPRKVALAVQCQFWKNELRPSCSRYVLGILDSSLENAHECDSKYS